MVDSNQPAKPSPSSEHRRGGYEHRHGGYKAGKPASQLNPSKKVKTVPKSQVQAPPQPRQPRST